MLHICVHISIVFKFFRAGAYYSQVNLNKIRYYFSVMLICAQKSSECSISIYLHFQNVTANFETLVVFAVLTWHNLITNWEQLKNSLKS